MTNDKKTPAEELKAWVVTLNHAEVAIGALKKMLDMTEDGNVLSVHNNMNGNSVFRSADPFIVEVFDQKELLRAALTRANTAYDTAKENVVIWSAKL